MRMGRPGEKDTLSLIGTGLVIVGGVGCLVVEGARATRRERARNSTAPRDPDRE